MMTNREINLAIAAECRIKGDFVSNLNAMHAAEMTLKGPDAFRYTQKLWRVIQPNERANYNTEQHVCATARQRAEAFLRTRGKWKE